MTGNKIGRPRRGGPKAKGYYVSVRGDTYERIAEMADREGVNLGDVVEWLTKDVIQ